MTPPRSLFVLLALVPAVGCGKAKPTASATVTAPVQPTTAVTGTVLFRGKPLAGATVGFAAAGGTASARGETDANGRFTLSTFAAGDGAVAGKYAVTVSVNEFGVRPDGTVGPIERPGPKAAVPARFTNPSQTPLAADVKPGKPNAFRFDVR